MDKIEIDNLLKLNGKIRGVVFQTDARYVLEKEGEVGLQELEEKAKRYNLPINYRSAKALEWCPIGLRIVSLLLIKETFGYQDSEIRKMGEMAPKVSFIVKLFFRLFLSPRKLAEECPRYWKEHHTLGELRAVRIDEDRNEIVLRLENYVVHPLFCLYLEGYFETVMCLARESRKAKAKEIACPFKDNLPFHDYLITWE